MPKVIGNARETILHYARQELLENGYEKLNIRYISKKCNIAVGTIYNYFSSKLILVAAIMLEDWKKSLNEMEIGCMNAGSIQDGLKEIYMQLTNFIKIYQYVWDMAKYSNEVKEELVNRQNKHQLLRSQLCSMIIKVFEQFNTTCDDFLPYFIADTLLLYSMEKDFDYEKLNVIYEKLL